MNNDRYIMIQDILNEIPNLTIEIMDAIRLAYFRGLSHSDDKDEILSKELKRGYESASFIPFDEGTREEFHLNDEGVWVSAVTGEKIEESK